MRTELLLFFLMGLFAQSCDSNRNEKNRNFSGTKSIAFSLKNNVDSVRLDSLFIEKFFIEHPEDSQWKERVLNFYSHRNFSPCWYNGDGIDGAAKKFITLFEESAMLYKPQPRSSENSLSRLFNEVQSEKCKFNKCRALKLELDVFLTASFFDYAERNWKGVSNYKSMEVGWFIERKKLNYESFLDSLDRHKFLVRGNDEPVFRQYVRLKRALLKYVALEKNGGWPMVSRHLKDFAKGDTSVLLKALKRQLYLMGDLAEVDSTIFFNQGLANALCSFQIRHGLNADSLLGESTWKALRVPLRKRIEQLLINMERCRWLPYEFSGDYLMVNIPDYKLSVFHQDSLEWSCKVVLGKQSNETVIFNDTVEYVVFSPYWNVPQSIVRKEIIPAIQKNRNYLAEHNMEVLLSDKLVDPGSVSWSKYTNENLPYLIRERPGRNNSLGLVKFLFPNLHHIYLHDTPAKSLFEESTRAFSHGCIRVQEPFKLAQYLLRDDPLWTPKLILEYMEAGVEKYVRLKTKVPIFIVYFTAWVAKDGKVNFRDDIYGHDAKMKALLLL